MSELRDRIALVTGGSRGIGRGIALALAEAGADVAVNFRSSEEEARAVAEAVRQRGRRALVVGADVARAAEVALMVGRVERELGPVGILVNNAGVARVQHIADVEEGDWDEILATNLKSAFLVTKAVLPGMRRARWGRILNVSSLAAHTGGIVGPHYAASKAGLHGLAHYLAARFARAGVTVNVLAPALIADTGLLPGEPEMLRHQVPVGRLGRPVEVADLAMAILRNPYLTSQVVSLDGGMYPR
jgi:3-oxoacyl-[acyl-carrier protein] reductase